MMTRFDGYALAATALLAFPASGQELQRLRIDDAASPTAGQARIETAGAGRIDPGAAKAAPAQLPGWPKTVAGHPNFAPQRGVVFADLDRNGSKDIVMSSTSGQLYAWDYLGNDLPGFPRTLIGIAQYAPSVGDLDGDGDLELVQFTRGITSGGRLYVMDHTGAPLPGFPKSVNNQNLDGCPTLYDLDDDGALEIVVPERSYPIGYLHVFERDGSEWGGNWPVALDHVPTGTTSVGDLDDDGEVELVYLSYTSLWALEVDGTPMPGFPKGIAGANFSYQSPALADLDGDGDLEIVVGAHQSNAGVYVFHHTGAPYPGWPKLVGTWTYCAPTVCDLDGDGSLDILAGREGNGPGVFSQVFWAWESNGAVKPGFPYTSTNGGGAAGPITTADIDGDGKLEIFTDHNIASGGLGYLFGVDSSGQDLPGFPLRPVGFTYFNGANIDDIDGDGDYELGVVSGIVPSVEVNLYDIGGSFAPADVAWGSYHVRSRRGGLEGSGDKLDGVGSSLLGGQVTLTLVGQPGDLGTLWAATSLSPQSTPFGWVYVTLPPRREFFFGAAFPASGQLVQVLPLPSDPVLFGVPIYFQGRRFFAGGGGDVTNVVSFVLQ